MIADRPLTDHQPVFRFLKAPHAHATARADEHSGMPQNLGRVAAVRAIGARYRRLTDSAFLAEARQLRSLLARDGLISGPTELACAYVVEAAARSTKWAARDGQVLAALCMLDTGLTEMGAGEGKSLAVAIAATTAALAGVSVHTIVATDHLGRRDAQAFHPLFDMLGLETTSIVAATPPEQRRSAGMHSIVYLTAREAAAIHLRGGDDGDAPSQRRRVAILDDADRLLLDDALQLLTPSRECADIGMRAFLWQAYALSGRLERGNDYVHSASERRVRLTDAGRRNIATLAIGLQPVWRNARQREEMILTALSARHVLKCGQDYTVTHPQPAQGFGAPARGHEIQVIDEHGERIPASPRWPESMRALVAIKEGCQAEEEAIGRPDISVRRLLLQYERVGGIGTGLVDSRVELAETYGLQVIAIPAQRPEILDRWPTRRFDNDDARWVAAVDRICTLSDHGRPVLIATESVGAAHDLCARLRKAGIDPALLTGRSDTADALVAAEAGTSSQVTVCNSRAGRGTHIAPDTRALRSGGLHVIVCQRNGGRRHEEEFVGRAARYGQPGSCETWLSPAPMTSNVIRIACAIAKFSGVLGGGFQSRLLDLTEWIRQRSLEDHQGRERMRLAWHDAEAERPTNSGNAL